MAEITFDEQHELIEIKMISVELIDAARPFTSSDIVDETTATISLMDRLDNCIKSAEGNI